MRKWRADGEERKLICPGMPSQSPGQEFRTTTKHCRGEEEEKEESEGPHFLGEVVFHSDMSDGAELKFPGKLFIPDKLRVATIFATNSFKYVLVFRERSSLLTCHPVA